MLITESQLRRIIRNVIKEENKNIKEARHAGNMATIMALPIGAIVVSCTINLASEILEEFADDWVAQGIAMSDVSFPSNERLRINIDAEGNIHITSSDQKKVYWSGINSNLRSLSKNEKITFMIDLARLIAGDEFLEYDDVVQILGYSYKYNPRGRRKERYDTLSIERKFLTKACSAIDCSLSPIKMPQQSNVNKYDGDDSVIYGDEFVDDNYIKKINPSANKKNRSRTHRPDEML